MLSFNTVACALAKATNRKEVKFQIAHAYVLIQDHTIACTKDTCTELNHCLFFELRCEENKFPFRVSTDLKRAIDCKFCSKLFEDKKKKNDHS